MRDLFADARDLQISVSDLSPVMWLTATTARLVNGSSLPRSAALNELGGHDSAGSSGTF